MTPQAREHGLHAEEQSIPREEMGGEAACWAHLLDKEGRLETPEDEEED